MMKCNFPININAYVKVKLTQKGFDLYKTKMEKLNKNSLCNFPLRPEIDEDGFYQTQLWSLMQDFGDGIHLGLEPPFETVIYLQNFS